jgi:hypothetical protein
VNLRAQKDTAGCRTTQAIEVYRNLNESFARRLVFRLGISAGFFSEYNNMILAMLYCLEHRIRFQLYSRDANFRIKRGWTDYFCPFTEESASRFHSEYNCRSLLEFEAKSREAKRFVRLYKALTRTSFLTHDLFEEIRVFAKTPRNFQIDHLKIDGGIQQAARALVNLTWRYNRETGEWVEHAIAELNLPDRFVGIHIRSGDKLIESTPYELAKYMDLAARSSAVRSAFIATDDFTNIEKLQKSFPDWDFRFLSRPHSRGYHQSYFDQLPSLEKRSSLLELFASVEVLARSELFVGTFTSNVGMYVGMRRERPSIGVDSEHWFVW